MISRLDVAGRASSVRSRFDGAALMGDMPLEQVTERLRGTIPILAAGQSFAPKVKRCPTSCSPTSLRSVGSTSASMATTSGRPNRSNRGFGLQNLRSAFLDAA
jgi:hypothetical protein